MTANSNIDLATSAVVIDNRMWAGSDPASTSWISGTAEGALHMLVVDFDCDATAATVFSLDDTAVLTAIPGVLGTKVVALLGATNTGASPAAATDYTVSGATITWTAAAVGVHRLTLLYV
tara:strand:+ start:109 stop:468 length:360 start_codon:yes stop_codon:yes gene_type:complete